MAFAASTNAPRANQASLARLFGVSRQSINELVKRGVIEQGQDGLIDVELARVAIANRVRPSSKTSQAVEAAPQPPSSAAASPPAQTGAEVAVTSYHVAKTLRETAEARIAELKLLELKGDLVRAADVRAAHAKRLAGLRESLLQIPMRLAAVLAAETSQAVCHDKLQAEIHGVLLLVSEG